MDSIAYQKIVKKLKEYSFPYTIHNHNDIYTVSDAKDRFPFDYHKAYKTLLFRKNEKFIFVVINSEQMLDYKKLATALKIKREEIKIVDQDTIVNELGYILGGLSPIPFITNSIVIFDNKILNENIIYCGIGQSDRTLEIKASDLITVCQGVIDSITK